MTELEKFLRHPTPSQWNREIRVYGWSGPDGSSCSRDNIEGVVIGSDIPRHEDSTLPANLHDWRYQQGRRKKLPQSFRKAADEGYRDGCLERVSHLVGFSGWKARKRCHIRYRALRWFGRRAWKER